MSFKQKVMAILGPLTVFLYLTVCFLFRKFDWSDGSIWWKMLPIFALNIIVPIVMGLWKIKFSVPLVITILYLLLGFISSYLGYPLWHPGWTIFLLIPVIEVILKPTKEKKQRADTKKTYDYEHEE